jgi:3-hydroxybutyryl-CoA dehydrogenase
MTIRVVGIVGSGIMAGGLAEVAARAGFDVVVASRRQDAADRLVQSVDCGLARAVERGKSTDAERQAILSRIAAVEGVEALAECDLVIESVVEDLAVKVELFGALDKVTKPSTILATNTSTLPVIDVALATSRPDLVCGIHFFNPATVMTLVEVVRPLTASDATIAAAMKFVTACGKEAVEVQDHAGFIVNALLFPYLNNAVRMLERGTATVESIDAAMRGGCNFPMGPFALLDLVGIDTSVAILNTIHASFGNACDEPAHTLLDMVAAGTLGRKTKHGFYQY